MRPRRGTRDQAPGPGIRFIDAVDAAIKSILDADVHWGFYRDRARVPQVSSRSVAGFRLDIIYLRIDNEVVVLTPTAERTRFVLYSHLARTGALPPLRVVAEALGLSIDELDAAIEELATTRNLVLRGGEIVLAHPFAARSFRFSVMSATTLWWGGCAWDAFAIPNLVPQASPVLVATTCPACGAAHAWTVTNEGPPEGDQVAHFLTPVDRIWPDAARACENQMIYCSERCVADWLRVTGHSRGYVMSLQTLWRLAEHWYDGRLDSPYIRREPSAAAEYFRSVGLHGPFWGLDE